MTLEAIGAANGVKFRSLKHKGMREGCHCIESRDLGAYDTCLNGCKYCYANKRPDIAAKNRRLHDPASRSCSGTCATRTSSRRPRGELPREGLAPEGLPASGAVGRRGR